MISMIKKIILSICMFATTLTCLADDYTNENTIGCYVDFQICYKPTKNTHGSYPRTPIRKPTVFIYQHSLYFQTSLDNYSIRIISAEDGNTVVFNDIITPGMTTYMLPSDLNGEYILQLEFGNFVFIGHIHIY